jgi:hypothetical protein
MKKSTLKRARPIRVVSPKTKARNGNWRIICLDRAEYLIRKYGYLPCEYSGEAIRTLSTVPNDLDDGWGHHMDGNRDNCTPDNCYIVKYKYHSKITDNNIQVSQEDFQGRAK